MVSAAWLELPLRTARGASPGGHEQAWASSGSVRSEAQGGSGWPPRAGRAARVVPWGARAERLCFARWLRSIDPSVPVVRRQK